ncbi:thioredoxin domain-containing protein [Methanobacterium alkalithermotolerans]|uniref:Thioredoxin domain-containing protein n=1 Tax=Methanobacterium alkalithermotolerans TaxID=2731220 RepID=A0A8T8KBS0_9EURY|nr:thioredoxin domain-containing protein [Methanobacterium alkalithermotolerans]QUH22831.1 thioredoxin domain-containing protein [Methanobacterium alkalithermotolerans]
MVSREKEKKFENHLINEKSPYLLQHAHNPVDWHPWTEDTFSKAKNENKPVFLSIGYSTCHWCHVMAHESFEDPEIGELLNRVFVPVKVDREERPDIDSTYMNVCQMMTGSGGWPLTIIMTPDKKPFFSGTYFPKESRYGNLGLKDIILKVEDLWKNKPQEALISADKIVNLLEKISVVENKEDLNNDLLDNAYTALKESFDNVHGGFGMIQKFPTPHNLYFLMRYWKRNSSDTSWKMVKKTLDRMQQGGIYDQVGFGFHRYAVDPEWLVPHFEKMLYDQALISMAYLESFQISGEEKYAKTAKEIFEYVLRDLKSPEGGFYSAEDADSEGVEGKFYMWSKEEIDVILGDSSELICDIFQVQKEGNFKEESTGKKTGKNILFLKKSLEEISKEKQISLKKLESIIEESRSKLFQVREKRIHPHKDDKILTDWNGLMIAALSRGAQVFKEERYLKAAEKAVDFIFKNLYSNKRLLHRYREGEGAINGYLDDYAFLIWGLLELYQASFKVKYLSKAFELNQSLLDQFLDKSEGGFYFTPADGETVLLRKKESYDSAIPSGNSVQVLNLLKMSLLSEDARLKETAHKCLNYFSSKIKRSPLGHTHFLNALDFEWGPYWKLVIACPPGKKNSKKVSQLLSTYFLPNLVMVLKEDGLEEKWPFEVQDSFSAKKSIENQCTAYLCSDKDCKNPTTHMDKLLSFIDLKKVS